MATNTAEILKLAARATPHESGERTWLEFRLKLENCLTLVNEKYVALLPDAESQTAVNVTAGSDETSVLIRTSSHTLYALVGDTDHGTKFETGATSAKQKRARSLETAIGGKSTEDSGLHIPRCCKLCCIQEWLTIWQS